VWAVAAATGLGSGWMAAAAVTAGSGMVGKVMLHGSEAVFLVLYATIADQTRSDNMACCISECNAHAGRSRGCGMCVLAAQVQSSNRMPADIACCGSFDNMKQKG
jgi:hypothetical protein